MGPDGQPLKVVRLQDEEDAFSGVAALERVESDSDATSWKRAALLAGGDAAVLLVFAAIGRANHSEGGGAVELVATALPFLLGWFATSPFLGGFGKEAQGSAAGPAALAAAKCWAVGMPLGLALRTLSKGYLPAAPFVAVSLGATALLLVGWRSALAAATPQAAQLSARDKLKQRKNKQGNPLEFIQMIISMTRRW